MNPDEIISVIRELHHLLMKLNYEYGESCINHFMQKDNKVMFLIREMNKLLHSLLD